ncbi:MAG: alpha-galactosidase [Candidatus Lokiarchaeota archaeon]|nr:alpha-galactosidase [Candidatus Lokiarchaeota archaeon]
MNEEYVLTPKSGPQPKITGPKVFGVRPMSPIIFKIPATGKRPLKYEVLNLPEEFSVDQNTGVITGQKYEMGEYETTLIVSNDIGRDTRQFTIKIGHRICLTPPMGWNSWYVYSLWITQEKVEHIAKAMVEKRLIDHGWTYVVIDDCWQGERKPGEALQPNSKFPDMKGMCDYVHSLGLKVGIYSTPWVGSYAGYRGGSIPNSQVDYSKWIVEEKYRQENNQIFGKENALRKRVRFFGIDMSHIDAKQFSEWGFDYLKYDWNPNDIEHVEAMQKALLEGGRDIVYSLSNKAPYKLGDKWSELANLWRTTGDIRDNWRIVARIGFSQNKWGIFAGPGHWNDPDMLQLGNTRHPHRFSDFFSTHLTADEQYSQMSLWCLLCAPLLLSCDIPSMDEFSLNLLTNDEVLEVNQDPLGKQAGRIVKKIVPHFEVWAKKMEDGTNIVGLFNRSRRTHNLYVKWDQLKIKGDYVVRDLWRQKTLGIYNGGFASKVPGHGVILLRLKSLQE